MSRRCEVSQRRSLMAIAVIATVVVACSRSPSASPVPAPGSTGPSSSALLTGSVRPDGCVTGQAMVVWAPDRSPVERVCAPSGTEIVLSMRPVENCRWLQLTSSDPTVAAVGPLGFDQEGTTVVTVTAARVGEATVTAVARPPDIPPNDPPRQRWVLTVRVVA